MQQITLPKSFLSYTIGALSFIASASLVSCGGTDDKALDKTKKTEVVINAPAGLDSVPKKYTQLDTKAGAAGIYDVPEMLTLCIRDSAKIEDMSAAFANAYNVLQQELKTLKIESNGAPGSLYYTNDPKNCVFECVFPIPKMPEKQPKHSQIVVLEACYMYVYNYYGDYKNLYQGYEAIRQNLAKNNLEQNGPMREFYITNPAVEKDSTKWLTRIMVPVGKKKKPNT